MEKQILKKLALERAVVSSFHVKNDPMLAGFKVNSNNFQCDDDDDYNDDYDYDDDDDIGYDY
ncbi:hypothetical protein H2O64_16530 [Kordia sp. YSTF-M3]|uniref:Uncharacterized protein n=1 Tax=Kordia aestuariivivens TaxID=2759037 RepID=A0ABR7QCI3_9FLAO|nr:hypothetical protein [Kordia aestuariivivens]MBC8756282.1 hypothetical protein [Kordia aestuariivivens]